MAVPTKEVTLLVLCCLVVQLSAAPTELPSDAGKSDGAQGVESAVKYVPVMVCDESAAGHQTKQVAADESKTVPDEAVSNTKPVQAGEGPAVQVAPADESKDVTVPVADSLKGTEAVPEESPTTESEQTADGPAEVAKDDEATVVANEQTKTVKVPEEPSKEADALEGPKDETANVPAVEEENKVAQDEETPTDSPVTDETRKEVPVAAEEAVKVTTTETEKVDVPVADDKKEESVPEAEDDKKVENVPKGDGGNVEEEKKVDDVPAAEEEKKVDDVPVADETKETEPALIAEEETKVDDVPVVEEEKKTENVSTADEVKDDVPAAEEEKKNVDVPPTDEIEKIELVPIVEEEKKIDDVPVVEEEKKVDGPAADEVKEIELAVVAEEEKKVNDVPVVEEDKKVDDGSVVEEEKKVDDVPATDEVKETEPAPVAEEGKNIDDVPVAEDVPAADETKEIVPAAAAEGEKKDDDVPATDEIEKTEPTPVAEEEKKVDDVPAAEEEKKFENVPATDEIEKTGPAPVAEEEEKVNDVPVAEEDKKAENVPATDEVKENEPAPAVDEEKKVDDVLAADEEKIVEDVPVADEVKKIEPSPVAEEEKKVDSVHADDKEKKVEDAPTVEEEKKVDVPVVNDLKQSVITSDDDDVRKDFSGYRVYRVTVPTEEAASWILKLEDVPGIEFWADPKLILRRQRFFVTSAADMMVAPDVVSYIEEVFQQARLPYEVLIDDVQKAIEDENPAGLPSLDLINRDGHNMTWDRYHEYEDIETYLKYLEETFPDFATVTEFGKTSEGRSLKAIRLHQDTGRKDKKVILIDAGIHAREWITPATLTYMIKELVENPAKYNCIMDEFDWVFIPVLNPDGYAYTHKKNRMWRKTRSSSSNILFRRTAEESLRADRLARFEEDPVLDDAILEKLKTSLKTKNGFSCTGTDANRNFGYKWLTGGSSRNPCSETFAGPAPFSEPETKALSDYILQNKENIAMYISLHAYSQMWLIPWGFTEEKPADYQELYTLAKIGVNALQKVSGTSYIIGSIPDLLYIASGSSIDWAKGEAGIKYSFTLELRDAGRHGFLLPANQIIATGKETWAAMYATARELARRVYPDAAQCDAI